ncbi:MAG: hypothetical protein ACJ8BW_38430, partial [Ktedonobacteraceae bacterium]
LGVSLLMMFALKYVGVLRVSKEGELEGLDLHEHGATAYPESALAGVGLLSAGQNGNGNGHHNGHRPIGTQPALAGEELTGTNLAEEVNT